MKKYVSLVLTVLLAVFICIPSQTAVPAQKLVRLHVLAASDSPYDQAIKLAVKERVLALATDLTKVARTAGEAKAILSDSLPELEKAANDTLAAFEYGYYARASLENCAFPKRNYGIFSLPAGTYDALRVVIGRGEGHNWWCVVFPQLFKAASAGEVCAAALEAGFTGQEVSALLQEDGAAHFKLKSVELFRKLLALFNS